jgi:hypothetical protein
MLYLDDVLSRHDLLTVQALALTTMYSFRAEVSLVSQPGTKVDADFKSGWAFCVVSPLSNLSSAGESRLTLGTW